MYMFIDDNGVQLGMTPARIIIYTDSESDAGGPAAATGVASGAAAAAAAVAPDTRMPHTPKRHRTRGAAAGAAEADTAHHVAAGESRSPPADSDGWGDCGGGAFDGREPDDLPPVPADITHRSMYASVYRCYAEAGVIACCNAPRAAEAAESCSEVAFCVPAVIGLPPHNSTASVDWVCCCRLVCVLYCYRAASCA
jgi:hypothetical protein